MAFLKERGEPGIKVLYITPLRALNRDMMKRLTQWSKELGITIEVRHGDTTMHERRKQALKPPDVLITTPETHAGPVHGLPHEGTPADRPLRHRRRSARAGLLQEGHTAFHCAREAGKYTEFQRIGLSATVGSPEEVSHFLGGTDRKVRIVEVSVEKLLDFNVIIAEGHRRR